MKLKFPIRFKIVLLILAALSASLLSYLYVGTQLIVEDKVSYIYDYTLAEVKSASDKIGSQLQKISSVGNMIGSIVRRTSHAAGSPSRTSPSNTANTANTANTTDATDAAPIYAQYAKELGISGALVLSPADADRFRVELALGDGGAEGAAHYSLALAQLGWTPRAFDKESILIGTPMHFGAVAEARVPIGVRTVSAGGVPLAFFTLARLEQALLRDGGKNYEIRLMDPLGRTLLTKEGSGGALASDEFEAFAKTLAQGAFDSGVRDWTSGGRDFITSYQRIAGQKLTVVSLISKETAFVAARRLVTRSLFLGLSILLLASGTTLILVRSVTRKLTEMWHATQKVSQGDFTVRVDTRKLSRDEVGGLALSFNTMADKIGELMVQTAQKARMEKELETAQAVQSRFFPGTAFDHEAVSLSGKYIPASECAGDWWHYARIGEQLIVVVGDVTGHGVSAALVTAAAHSAFSLMITQLAKPETQTASAETSLAALISALNTAVLAAGDSQSTMTFIGSIIDLRTGLMTSSNASHPPLYIYRKPAGEPPGNPLSCFKPVMDGRIASLGEKADIEIATTRHQLQPGDRIFWYTDGILDSRVSDGQKMNKMTFLKLLAAKSQAETAQATQICGEVMSEALQFFGSGPEDRPDDITFVVASIPAHAQFETTAPSERAAS